MGDETTELKLTATKWLIELKSRAEIMGIDTRYKSWPKSANYLSRKLKELENTLLEVGIKIEWLSDPKTKERLIEIRNISSVSSVSSPNENQAQKSTHEKVTGDGSDDRDDTLRNFKGKEIDSDETDDEDPSDYDDNEEPDTQ